jgi:MYXO-CTERM domain-containing protein
MKTIICTFVGVLACVNASAAPSLLDASNFAVAIAPLTSVVENFEAFQQGYKSSPLQLANSSFSSPNPYVGNFGLFPTQGVIDQGGGAISFSDFLSGTTVFGANLAGYVASDLLEVTVVGRGGTSTFRSSINSYHGFMGVEDAQGLISVGFKDLGSGPLSGNYGFDNVTVGVAAIPEPPPAALASLGLLMLGLLRLRRRQVASSSGKVCAVGTLGDQ